KSVRRRLLKKHLTRSKKRVVRYSLLTANIAILGVVIGFVTSSPSTSPSEAQSAALGASDSRIADPLDQLSSADIAVHVARMANLDETTSVVNHADSMNAQLAIAPIDESVAPKPQIVSTDLKSKQD